MRISDWSSDVCSSDLDRPICPWQPARPAGALLLQLERPAVEDAGARPQDPCKNLCHRRRGLWLSGDGRSGRDLVLVCAVGARLLPRRSVEPGVRSEEHTSELQSLMRISYAVFCLKKQTIQTTLKRTHKI